LSKGYKGFILLISFFGISLEAACFEEMIFWS